MRTWKAGIAGVVAALVVTGALAGPVAAGGDPGRHRTDGAEVVVEQRQRGSRPGAVAVRDGRSQLAVASDAVERSAVTEQRGSWFRRLLRALIAFCTGQRDGGERPTPSPTTVPPPPAEAPAPAPAPSTTTSTTEAPPATTSTTTTEAPPVTTTTAPPAPTRPVATPRPTPGPTTTVPTGDAANEAAAETFTLINRTRAEQGLAPLAWDDELGDKAQAWAERLAAENRLYHSTLSDGVSPGYRGLGENVGYGGSVAQVHQSYLGSPGHRQNIVNTGWTHAGTGAAVGRGGRVYTVHVFMERR